MKEKCRTFSLCRLSRSFTQMVIVASFLLAYSLSAFAQTGVKVKGVVTSGADGFPLIGVNVVQKGTTNGTVTDLDGNYELTVPTNAEVEFSYIGYLNQTIRTTAGETTYNVILKEDSQALDEVVVVGYGVQKKKLVTGATVQVKGDDIAKLNTTNVLGALQSQSPGVQITQSSGQPGEGFKVNIRGIGTIGNSAPLYVIDGVAGGDINSLNPSDIESIDVLKDAASAAIYGARAANGVILVTTKQGKAGKLQLSYDGYAGGQYLYKRPDVLNAQEFIFAMDLIAFNDGTAKREWGKILPADLYASVADGSWKGTDWIDESYKKGALMQNHAINLVGGSDASKFSMGFAYTSQDGIFGGEAQSKFDRYTARLNSDHVVYKVNDMEVIKIGETMTFNHTGKSGIATGNLYWNNMHDLLIGNPLLPAYNENGEYYMNADKTANGWAVGNAGNPLAAPAMSSQGLNENKSYNVNLSAYLQIQPIRDLILKSQFGYRMGTSSYRSYSMLIDNGSTSKTQEEVSQNMSTWSSLSWENTAAYKLTIDKHNIDLVAGASLEKNGFGIEMKAMSKNTLFEKSFDHAYLSNTKPTSVNDIIANDSFGGWPSGDSSLASFFGRVNYNYAERYMAQLTVRADGSSNFSRGNRWGYFPSASAGWVVSNEGFMEDVKNWMDFLKLRISWGQNGNCSIDNFQYLTTFAFDESSGYFFGVDNKTALTTGGYANILQNPDVTWETSETLNLGVDARFLNSRLGLTFDYYEKNTKDWLLRAPVLSVYGLNAPYVNGGDVKNSGFELGLNWNDYISDFTYGASLNVAYNKNEVTRIANAEGIIHGPSDVYMQGTPEIYRAQVGLPIGYFYGMKTAGIFQNQAQIDEWSTKYSDEIHGTPKPGDIIFVDTDNNGKINSEDRTMIGNPHPNVNLGFSLNLGYKGFDFSVTGAGAFGHELVRSTNSGNSQIENLNKKLLYESWAGEGTSNRLPKLTNLANINWKTFSEVWIEKGDYVKIQNVTLGYDFKKILPKMPLQQARLYVTAQNLFTFTSYSGMDPEVGASGNDDYKWSSGIDLGFYPSPKAYLVGVNLKF